MVMGSMIFLCRRLIYRYLIVMGLILYKGNSGWDGRYKGRLVEPDTYFYLIHYPDKNKQLQTKKGLPNFIEMTDLK